ncbi:MAG: signal recognition particle protein [Clostridia bacterium]|nr:signal recognition particle protein [Clostridia bacterium]MBQ2737846.1 signal recognition particle protein [Clostridia bacterium]MBQ8289556.1 signal recognition particle protein [Clostridia bacterium]
MLEGLTEKLANAFKRFRSKGKLTAADVKEGMREVKLALLEADVNFKVVKEFVSKVTERAVGAQVLESLLPHQQIVKIVNEELIALMGGETPKINISPKPPTVVMMVGLQGAGKTTHAGKIARMYKQKGKNPLLVACDVYRPAAIDQLHVVGQSADIPVFSMGSKISPVEIARAGVEHARKNGNDMVFIDTAGRLHIDEELMAELVRIKDVTAPSEILLVVDAMTGQDAVNVAKSFNELLDITGVVLTKIDGDTRGGAALSVKYITGKPIKFLGTGEKLDAIELFHPDRMASRILGMGDVLTLIEKAEAAFDEKNAKELEKKMREQTFTLEDFLMQMRQLKKMGNLDQLLGMIPGLKTGALKDATVDEKQMVRTEAIILSMTKKERTYPDTINGSRRRRIALGSGTSVEEVNKLLKQFEQMKKMMKQMTGMGKRRMFPGMKLPF